MSDLISRSAFEEVLDELEGLKAHAAFTEGIMVARRELEQFPAVDAMPKWISVEDRLPEIGDQVLVTDDFGCVGTGTCDTFGYRRHISVDGCSQFGCIPTVKYWMPLPEPPKEDT